MAWKYGDASDDYLLADILKKSSLGRRFIFNPITSRYINNNSTNRKSIIQQIKTSRLNSQGIQYYADSDGGGIKITGKSIALIGCSSKKKELLPQTEFAKLEPQQQNMAIRRAILDYNEQNASWGDEMNGGFVNPDTNDKAILEGFRKDMISGNLVLDEDGVWDEPENPVVNNKMKAKELYCSPLFEFSQAWADNRWIEYGILSAEHPELAKPISGPEMLIENYDNKITSLNPKEQKSWARRVVSNITKPKPAQVSIIKRDSKAITKKRFEAKNEIKKIYLLAGKSYTNVLIPELKKKFPNAELIEPLSGMQIGERLKFLKADKDGFQQAADKEYGPGNDPRGFRIKTGKIAITGNRGKIPLSPDPEEIYRPSKENRLLSDLLDSGAKNKADYEQYMALITKRKLGS